MSSSLDDVGFLVGSSNRIAILDAIRESPRTPHELRSLTGASRITVNRILDDLEDQRWIVRSNGQLEPTTQGTVIADEVGRLLSTVAAVRELGDALSWLPVEEFDFDVGHLTDARVVHTASWKDHAAAIRRTADLVSGATRIWGTAIGFSHEVAAAIRAATVEDGASFEVVIDGSTLDMIRADDGLRSRFGDVASSPNGTISVYDGEPPLHMVMVLDETVSMCGHVDGGVPPGTIETTDATVRAWARTYYESARDRARPIDAGALTSDPSFTA